MTEQDIRTKIRNCEGQINSSYKTLLSASSKLGSETYNAALGVGANASSSASGKIAAAILIPLILSLIGIFVARSSGFLGFLFISGGIALSIGLGVKFTKRKHNIQANMNNMSNQVKAQDEQLESFLNGNKII